MSEELFEVGAVVVITATFRDPETKALVDPEVVVCTVRAPDAPESENVTPEVEHLELGKFRAKVSVDRPGRWYAAFDAVGDYAGAHEHSFQVRDRYVPR